jgi:hypothetical protein
MKLHSDLSCFFIFLDYILDRTGNLADSYVPICRDKEQQSSVPEQNLQSPWTRLSAENIPWVLNKFPSWLEQLTFDFREARIVLC